MSDIKDRKVFSLSQFRGLDKENKPIKVAPFRATDGYNFMIDSGTLKTRPAIKMHTNPNFYLASGDKIIAWQYYDGITLYVTKNHFYIDDGTTAINETNTSILITSIVTLASMEGKTPVFKEEKECLFIFGLNQIYVFSIIKDVDGATHRYVLYALDNKPTNPFSAEENYYLEQFNDLPIPYEPTIFLDESSFEDVNLLSKKTKYRLFASSKNTSDGQTKYSLPTHYDVSKHNGFNSNITFYKGVYDDVVALPVFLGIDGENFDVGSLGGGASTAVSTTFTIKETFRPEKDFEYIDGTPDVAISTIYGLNKLDFFKMTVNGTSKTTFEWAMDYIRANAAGWTGNYHMIFSMPVEYTSQIRDATTNNIIETAIQQSTVNVYVSLKKYDDQVLTYVDEDVSEASVIGEDTLTDPYPTYPTVAHPNSGTYVVDSEIVSNAIMLSSPELRESIFTNICKEYMNARISSFTDTVDEDWIRLKGKFYYPRIVGTVEKTFSLPTTWDATTYSIGTLTDELIDEPILTDFVDNVSDTSLVYPEGSASVTYSTFIDVGPSQSSTFYKTTTAQSRINAAIIPVIDTLFATATTATTAILELYVYSQYGDVLTGNTYYKCIMMHVVITYCSTHAQYVHDRYSMVYIAEVQKTDYLLLDNMYSFALSNDKNFFEFIVDDILYDYKNEPSIDIEVNFDLNPNYSIIANSNFGISFGSENRLFLAGNEDYPNIDRYNVSNDLLGDGIKNQSYELSYFPSKNYRVVGGKAAINGYVLAADSQLYVTKTKTHGDDCFFIRDRVISDDGVVSYKEYRTNINKTPINHRCVTRFNNDILMLTLDGLYAIEIASNVLTNERLIKLRSGFINNDLKDAIALCDVEDLFILENNEKMYIVVGEKIFVADSRYVATNENNPVENISYELIEWNSDHYFVNGVVHEGEPLLLTSVGNMIYNFEEGNSDEYVTKHATVISATTMPDTTNTVFVPDSSIDYIFIEPEKYQLFIPNAHKVLGVENVDYAIVDATTITITNDLAFRSLTDGDYLQGRLYVGAPFYAISWVDSVISNFEANNRESLNHTTAITSLRSTLYTDVSDVALYITYIYEYLSGVIRFRASPYKPDAVVTLTQEADESDETFDARIVATFEDNDDYDLNSLTQNIVIKKIELITLEWKSAITDFGNNLMEKTTFKMLLHATKLDQSNTLQFGYRTLRRLNVVFGNETDLSNVFNFSDINLNLFGLATFSNVGMSFPMKENNFLYMQFSVLATGQIELNSIEIIYKNNRMLKLIS